MTAWLVVGADGQLGRDLMTQLGPHAIGLDLPELDITSASSVAAALETHQPDVVVNCAAYTAVDAAEEHEDLALLVNGVGPALLASACAASGSRLVQVSTDYVFSGTADQPYDEASPVAPINAYGRTKRAGELAVLHHLPAAGYVVRTAWLYGAGGANFVKTVLSLERERTTLRIVADQIGQPTWTSDLAAKVIELIESDAPAGIYHGTSSGRTSWFGLTQEIFRQIGADPRRVEPTTTGEFPRPAARPAFSVLGHRRLQEVGLGPIRSWKSALEEAIPDLR